MALALDGSAGLGSVTATTVISGTLTTTQTNDVLVAVVFVENTANAAARTTTGVKLTTAGTAFTKYTSLVQATDNELSIWWLASAGTIAQSITATASGTCDDLAISVFGVSGANTSSPWDADGPFTNTGTTNVAPSVTGVSTVGTTNMLLAFCGIDYHLASATAQTAGAMAGTTGTLINSDQGSGGAETAAEYRVLSSAIASQSVAFGTAVGASKTWAIIAASIKAAGGTVTPQGGWFFEPPDITQVTEAIGF